MKASGAVVVVSWPEKGRYLMRMQLSCSSRDGLMISDVVPNAREVQKASYSWANAFDRQGGGNILSRALNAIVIAVTLSGLLLAKADAEPFKLRVGWIAPVSDLVSIAFLKPGIAKHNGKSYELELVHFQGSSQVVTALAAGELQIGLLGFSTFPLAVENAGMSDLRIIADEIRDGVDGYYSNEFMVRKDSPIQEVEDLRHKVLATNAIGSGLDITMRAMLIKHGLGGKNATTVVEAPLPSMTAMLVQHKVDLIVSLPPFSYDPVLRNAARTLFTERDALGLNELAFFVARSPVLEGHRAAIVDFLEDYLRAVRWYSDPANHEEAVAIASKFSKLPPSVFESWLLTRKDEYRDPNGQLDVQALQSNIDLVQQLGVIKRKLDVKPYIDLSLVHEAATHLD